MGYIDLSLKTCKQVLNMEKSPYEMKDRSIPDVLINMAIIMRKKGDYTLADKCLTQAMSITKGLNGKNHYLVGDLFAFVGMLWFHDDMKGENLNIVLEKFMEARGIYEKVNINENDSRLILVLEYIARIERRKPSYDLSRAANGNFFDFCDTSSNHENRDTLNRAECTPLKNISNNYQSLFENRSKKADETNDFCLSSGKGNISDIFSTLPFLKQFACT